MSENERETRTPSQKRSIAKKNAVVATAKEMFLEKGYVAVNTNEIAKQAGVSVGTLYSYFKDKREIFLHIMEDCNTDFRVICEKNRTALDANDDPRITLMRFLDTMMSALSVYGSLFHEYHTHVANSVEEKRAFFAGQNQIMFEIFMGLLDSWSDKLRVTNKQVATLMVLEWAFTIVDLIAENRHPVPPEVLKHELLDTVCRYLFH
ncbi:MAG: TetR/AcrR family transcriptional regulator [Defluviitaleaceae bacterium]|nr:TetR/AcrR family transcriptional regulator [Defluviitaleaceae bacterium]